MQQLLAHYLFQYKHCPLAQFGALHITSSSAIGETGTQTILPPLQTITFSDNIIDSRNLSIFIAENKGISEKEAAYQLKQFTEEIIALKDGGEFIIEGVGTFSKSSSNKIMFKEVHFENTFTLPVQAERVIHPDDSHAILVGDTETDRNTMTEFFTETEAVKKDKWWLWAAILFVISSIMIFAYVNAENHNSFFGIGHKYEVNQVSGQYQNIP